MDKGRIFSEAAKLALPPISRSQPLGVRYLKRLRLLRQLHRNRPQPASRRLLGASEVRDGNLDCSGWNVSRAAGQMPKKTTTRQDVKTVVRRAFQPDSERDTVRLESLTYLIFWRVVEKKPLLARLTGRSLRSKQLHRRGSFALSRVTGRTIQRRPTNQEAFPCSGGLLVSKVVVGDNRRRAPEYNLHSIYPC